MIKTMETTFYYYLDSKSRSDTAQNLKNTPKGNYSTYLWGSGKDYTGPPRPSTGTHSFMHLTNNKSPTHVLWCNSEYKGALT